MLFAGDEHPHEVGGNLSYVVLHENETAVNHLSAGFSHTCATLASNGGLKCWGTNVRGELGIGTSPLSSGNVSSLPFVDVGGGEILQVECGKDFTCVLLSPGHVKCWGDNGRGQLGLGVADASIAVPTGIVNVGFRKLVRHIKSVGSSVCALLHSNEVKCWGQSLENLNVSVGHAAGEMGDALASIGLPAEATHLVRAGQNTICAIFADHTSMCFGQAARNLVECGSYDFSSATLSGSTTENALTDLPAAFGEKYLNFVGNGGVSLGNVILGSDFTVSWWGYIVSSTAGSRFFDFSAGEWSQFQVDTGATADESGYSQLRVTLRSDGNVSGSYLQGLQSCVLDLMFHDVS